MTQHPGLTPQIASCLRCLATLGDQSAGDAIFEITGNDPDNTAYKKKANLDCFNKAQEKLGDIMTISMPDHTGKLVELKINWNQTRTRAIIAIREVIHSGEAGEFTIVLPLQIARQSYLQMTDRIKSMLPEEEDPVDRICRESLGHYQPAQEPKIEITAESSGKEKEAEGSLPASTVKNAITHAKAAVFEIDRVLDYISRQQNSPHRSGS